MPEPSSSLSIMFSHGGISRGSTRQIRLLKTAGGRAADTGVVSCLQITSIWG